MIYLCQSCGWRINERYNSDMPPENVGKHLIYQHKAFCSEDCIETAKSNPGILTRTVVPSDWNEQLNGAHSNWKIERKINRQRNK